jgi:hypothetical protein
MGHAEGGKGVSVRVDIEKGVEVRGRCLQFGEEQKKTRSVMG